MTTPWTLDARYRFNGVTDREGRIALALDDGDLTYAALDRQAARLAARLRHTGIVRGSVVALWTGSRGEYFSALLALWRIGAVAVPMSSDAPADYTASVIRQAAPVLLVRGEGMALPDGWSADKVMEHRHGEGGREAMEVGESDGPSERDLAAVLFTSGTTGEPKGVMLTHEALARNAVAMGELLALGPDDRLLTNIPFYFTSLISHFLATMFRGGALVPRDRFAFGPDLIRMVLDTGATVFGGAPIQLKRMSEILAVAPDQAIGALGRVMTSGDALPVTVIDQWRRRLPHVGIFVVYGLTELGGRFCVLTPDRLDAKKGSVGRPILGLTVTVRDDDGALVATPGQMGQVFASGAMVMEGYLGKEAETRKTLTPHGLATGDIGSLDADGFLFLEGRSDDVFKSSGEKVSAKQIENVVLETGLFDDICVLPVENPHLGNVPFLWYVVKEGITFKRGAFMELIKTKLPSSALPKGFVPVERIPRTGSGKVIRKEAYAILKRGKTGGS